MPHPTPGYEYEEKKDRKVTLRLTKVFSHEYSLQFTTADDNTVWLTPSWTTVNMYIPTYSPSIEPGTGCPDMHYGNWSPRLFHVADPADGRLLLAQFQAKIRTVGDIYRMFIEDGVKMMENDSTQYRNYIKSVKAMPEIYDDSSIPLFNRTRQ